MSNGTIDLLRNNFVATLVINRPAKLNALTPEMLEQLLTHCHTLETDSEIRVVLLTSASEKAFCVGADIHRWSSLSALDMWRNWIRRGHQAFDALAQLPQPVIALMHGLAYGGGLELAATADIRICSDEARMALPETGLATVPGWSGTQRLTALIGRSLVKVDIYGRTTGCATCTVLRTGKSCCRQRSITRCRAATGTTYRPARSHCCAASQTGY